MPPKPKKHNLDREVIEYIRPKITDYQEKALFGDERYAMIEASTKTGKAQPLDALISTPKGWRRMGDLKVGDTIHGRKGNTRVIGVYPQGVIPTYRITFADGSTTTASGDHLWTVQSSRGKERTLTTEQLAQRPQWDFRRSYIPQHRAVVYAEIEKPIIDAWLLGFLTGDGGFTTQVLRVAIDPKETGTIDKVRKIIERDGLTMHYEGRSDWKIKKPKERYKHNLIQRLKQIGLWGLYGDQKFTPDFIKYGSIETRIAYIQGLLDSDGSVNKNGQPCLLQTSERLAEDFTHIIRSLGGIVLNSKKKNSYIGKDGKRIIAKDVYRQYVAIDNSDRLFSLSRNKEKCRVLKKPVKRTFRKIEYIGDKECQCISVGAKDRLYLTDDFITTHNTVGCIVWLIEQTMKLRAGQNTWWVAPISAQANIAFKRAMIFLPRSMYSFNLTDRTVTLPNGATMWFKGADKPNSLYGEDVFAAVVDEASRVKEDAWFAVRSTLTATKGKVRLIGNVKGRKNWFFHLCRMAENGEPNMVYHKLTAYDAVRAGILSLEEVEDAKRKLPSHIFNELYLAEPSDDGGNPFGLRAIANCVDQNFEPIEPGQLDISWRSQWSGVVGWGWDLAKSHDWCVGVGLNEDGGVAALERFQLPWEQTVARIVQTTAGCNALVDSTGVGDPVLERLQTLAPGQFEGFKFTSASKQQLMEGLALAIHGREIAYPNGIIVLELEQFEFVVTRTGVRYTAPQGLHDDVVCALALAVQKMKTPRAYFFEVN